MSKLGKIRKENTSVLGREQVEFLKMLRGGKQQDEDIELPKNGIMVAHVYQGSEVYL